MTLGRRPEPSLACRAMDEYEIGIATVTSRPTAVSRGVAKSWSDFASRWKPMLDDVWAYLANTDLRTDGHNVMVYRGNVPNLEFEVGVEVPRTFDAHGAVVPSSLPAGMAASTILTGDYAGLGEAHSAIAGWCRANGYSPRGTRWEIYGDWDPDPNKVQTALYWLVEG
jgi:hypothetical protein